MYKYVFWVLAMLILTFNQWCPPVWKGKIGEWRVKRALGKDVENEYYVINDVTVSVDGKSSQIDHVAVTDRGIFCIETKNYAGRIYGEEKQLQWTQVLAYGKVKNKFYNPVKQNATHVLRLQEVLGSDTPIYSAVVFVQGNIKFIKASNVIRLESLKKYVQQNGTATLSSEQIVDAANRIRMLKESNTVTAKEHIEEIQKMQEDIQNNICPRCGSALILRHGKYGDFYGCSKYPECKFTKKIAN